MQTINVATMLLAISTAAAFVATGYVATQVRPNGMVLVSNGATLVIKVG